MWPESYYWAPQASWLEPIRLGLEPLVEMRRAPLAVSTRGVVPFVLELAGREHRVAVDYGDDPRLDPAHLEEYELVFKMQYLTEGYASDRVVPGGFVPNSQVIYRYLDRLRALRRSGRRTSDLYGRFGGQKPIALRRQAVDMLRAQTSFRFRGGFDRVRYTAALAEAACARSCLDLPGLGPLCFRLVDYLAVGVPIVSPVHACRLHVPLEEGVHVAYCRPDLSDLVETVEELLRDPPRAERMAGAAAAFFDSHLHYRQLARYYLETCLERL